MFRKSIISRKKILYTLLFIIATPVPLALAKPGSLDKSFGTNGKVVTDIVTTPEGNHALINGITIYDNRIVAAGSMKAVTPLSTPMGIIARYNHQGNLDKTFNGLGYVTNRLTLYNAATMITAPFECTAILTAGVRHFFDSTEQYTAGQFHLTGTTVTPDCHFGFRNNDQLAFPSSLRSEARAVALDSGTHIIVAGSVLDTNNARHFGLAKTSYNGFITTGFGTNGFVQTSISDTPNNLEQINAVAVTSDDSIVVAGQALIQGEKRFVVARYTKDGVLDTTFGTLANPARPQGLHTGKVIVDFASATNTNAKNDSAHGIIIQPDGKLVVAGYAHNDKGTFSVALIRFTPEGTLDDTFGNGGITISSLDSISVQAYALTQQKNGSLVIAGAAIAPFSNDTQTAGQQFMVARYSPDGYLDTEFGSHGSTYTSFNNEGAVAYALALDEDENIVVGGYNFSDAGIARFALARYLSA